MVAAYQILVKESDLVKEISIVKSLCQSGFDQKRDSDVDYCFSVQKKCDLKHPPGDEIYRSGTLSMFEVCLHL